MFVLRRVPAVRKTALGDRAVLARFGLHRTVLIVITSFPVGAFSARHENDREARAGMFRSPGKDVVSNVRILFADDHELVRQGIRAVLDREPGWVVCGEATTGRQALAMATELKPDVMILDVGLPEMNGLEVTQRVRSTSSVAVLIVTVHDADQIVQEAIEAGASGYVLKADAGRGRRIQNSPYC
jgi:CheY-like chemotaxis protein